jgi:DNA-binding NtrC family response regulator
MSDNRNEKAIRILLIDDEVDLVTYLGQRLQKRRHLVSTATNGPDGIELAKKQVFDVALVDLKMPEMDGIAVMAELQALQPYLEAIMLTGHGSHNSALQAGKLNAYRYLIKPYDFDKLVEQIEEAAATRCARLREDFQRKLDEVINSNASPREIISESDRLRREYEQD